MSMRLSVFRALLPVIAVLYALPVRSAGLVPHYVCVQTGGAMGAVSAGPGWRYGSGGRWETEIIFGVIPKYDSSSAKALVAVKENFVPWSVGRKEHLRFYPLSASIYFTTLISERFWLSQPDRYPTGYYGLPTKVRSNVALGQRLEWNFSRRRAVRSVAVFYEISTCDIYLLNAVGNSCLSPADWLQLCLGARINF